jgi:hypothetical protein
VSDGHRTAAGRQINCDRCGFPILTTYAYNIVQSGPRETAIASFCSTCWTAALPASSRRILNNYSTRFVQKPLPTI